MGIVEDIITELQAEWDTSVISMPTFFAGIRNNLTAPNQVRITKGAGTTDAQNLSGYHAIEDINVNAFGFFASRSDAEDADGELVRILVNMTVTNGWIVAANFDILDLITGYNRVELTRDFKYTRMVSH